MKLLVSFLASVQWLLHVMKSMCTVGVFFFLSACRMSCISPGILLCQIHPSVAWLTPQALKDAQAVALQVVLKHMICHRLQPLFLVNLCCTVYMSLVSFLPSPILFSSICSFVQYLTDTVLMVVCSSDGRFCGCK